MPKSITNIAGVTAILQHPDLLKAFNDLQTNNGLYEKLNEIMEYQKIMREKTFNQFVTIFVTVAILIIGLVIAFVIMYEHFDDIGKKQNRDIQSLEASMLSNIVSIGTKLTEQNDKLVRIEKKIIEQNNKLTKIGKKFNEQTIDSLSTLLPGVHVENSDNDDSSFVDVDENEDDESISHLSQYDFREVFYEKLERIVKENDKKKFGGFVCYSLVDENQSQKYIISSVNFKASNIHKLWHAVDNHMIEKTASTLYDYKKFKNFKCKTMEQTIDRVMEDFSLVTTLDNAIYTQITSNTKH